MTRMVSGAEPVTVTRPVSSMTWSGSGWSGAAGSSAGEAHARSTPADSANAAPARVIR